MRKQTWTYLTQWPWAVAVITLPWWKHWQQGADASRYLLLHCASRTWDYATSNTRHMARQCAWSHKHFGSSLAFSPAADYLQDKEQGLRMHSTMRTAMHGLSRARGGDTRLIRWPPTLGVWEDSVHQASIFLGSPSHAFPCTHSITLRLSIEHRGDGKNLPGMSIFAIAIITLVINSSQTRDVKTSPCQNVGSSNIPSSTIIDKLKSLHVIPSCLAIK